MKTNNNFNPEDEEKSWKLKWIMILSVAVIIIIFAVIYALRMGTINDLSKPIIYGKRGLIVLTAGLENHIIDVSTKLYGKLSDTSINTAIYRSKNNYTDAYDSFTDGINSKDTKATVSSAVSCLRSAIEFRNVMILCSEEELKRIDVNYKIPIIDSLSKRIMNTMDSLYSSIDAYNDESMSDKIEYERVPMSDMPAFKERVKEVKDETLEKKAKKRSNKKR